MQLAKAHGMFVIGTASTEQGLQAVRDNDADVFLNHKDEGYLDEIAVGIRHLSMRRIALNFLRPIECYQRSKWNRFGN